MKISYLFIFIFVLSQFFFQITKAAEPCVKQEVSMQECAYCEVGKKTLDVLSWLLHGALEEGRINEEEAVLLSVIEGVRTSLRDEDSPEFGPEKLLLNFNGVTQLDSNLAHIELGREYSSALSDAHRFVVTVREDGSYSVLVYEREFKLRAEETLNDKNRKLLSDFLKEPQKYIAAGLVAATLSQVVDVEKIKQRLDKFRGKFPLERSYLNGRLNVEVNPFSHNIVTGRGQIIQNEKMELNGDLFLEKDAVTSVLSYKNKTESAYEVRQQIRLSRDDQYVELTGHGKRWSFHAAMEQNKTLNHKRKEIGFNYNTNESNYSFRVQEDSAGLKSQSFALENSLGRFYLLEQEMVLGGETSALGYEKISVGKESVKKYYANLSEDQFGHKTVNLGYSMKWN